MALDNEKMTDIEQTPQPEPQEQAVEDIVNASDAVTDQTISAVSSDSAIFANGIENINIEEERKKQRVGKVFKNIMLYTVLTICAVLAFLPFYWMIISSLKTEMEYRLSVPTFFPTDRIMWKNYASVLSQSDNSFWQVLTNTLVIGFFSTIIGVIITILTAYAFARMKFRGKNVLFALMLATMMIPGELYTITNYLTVSAWQWSNTYTVLILPFLVSTYYIYLLRNNFMQIPDSLYKAAKVDGLSDMGYLIKVMVPLTAPTLISITLLKFIGTWNSYIWPRLANKSESWRLVTNWVMGTFTDEGGLLYGGELSISEGLYTLKMAAVCLVSLPLFVLFVTCRKYIMRGVSKSGTKG